MDIKVNANTLNKALNDKKFTTELIEYLNGVVDEELEKGTHMDTDLITDCTEIIFELENGYEELSIQRETSKNIIKFCHKNIRNNIRRRQIAAVIAVMIASYATLYTASPAFALSVNSLVYSVVSLLQDADERTEKEDSDVLSIFYTCYGFDENDKFKNLAELDDFKLELFLNYEDGSTSEEPIPIDVHFGRHTRIKPMEYCEISKTIIKDGSKRYIALNVSYEGKSSEITLDMED